MRCVTRGTGWIVVADWFGADRVVFSGPLFDCLDWIAEN